MKRMLMGLGVMVAGLGVLLAMVVRVIEPSVTLSLASYAVAFVGMMLVLSGLGRRLLRGR